MTDTTSRVATRSKDRDLWWIAFAILALPTLFFLLAEHRAHLFGALPYLLVLACPVLHLVTHRRHGHRH